MTLLATLFLVTAVLYSSVGFGGGSTYLALLLIWGIPYFIFPVIALSCNIIVVSGNCFNYIRAGNLNLKLLTPYLIGSIPLAFIGGSLPIEKISGIIGQLTKKRRFGRSVKLLVFISRGFNWRSNRKLFQFKNISNSYFSCRNSLSYYFCCG